MENSVAARHEFDCIGRREALPRVATSNQAGAVVSSRNTIATNAITIKTQAPIAHQLVTEAGAIDSFGSLEFIAQEYALSRMLTIRRALMTTPRA